MDPDHRARTVRNFPRLARPVVDRVDIIGLGDDLPSDEYDCIVTEASMLLASDVPDLERRLESFIKEHFGIAPYPGAVGTFARELAIAWHVAGETDATT